MARKSYSCNYDTGECIIYPETGDISVHFILPLELCDQFMDIIQTTRETLLRRYSRGWWGGLSAGRNGIKALAKTCIYNLIKSIQEETK